MSRRNAPYQFEEIAPREGESLSRVKIRFYFSTDTIMVDMLLVNLTWTVLKA